MVGKNQLHLKFLEIWEFLLAYGQAELGWKTMEIHPKLLEIYSRRSGIMRAHICSSHKAHWGILLTHRYFACDCVTKIHTQSFENIPEF